MPPFRETCGQTTSIANSIRRNLDNYTSSQVFGELLQNADDAGASRVGYMLDKRQHRTKKLYGSSDGDGRMSELQGPALLMYDSATFKDNDWKGLMAFGEGSKELDPTQTGKFGLGFNSVYHLTEVPMFVSGEYWVALDPQRKFVPGLTPAVDPGLRTKPSTEIFAELEDQFLPFRVPPFQCDLSTERNYQGTLFRFPLRTESQAKESQLRPGQPFTIQEVAKLFDEFIKTSESVMLFLNHVTQLDFFVWEEGSASPRPIHKVILHGEDLKYRGECSRILRRRLDEWSERTRKPWRSTRGSLWELMKSADRSAFPRVSMKLTVQVFSGEDDRLKYWREYLIREGVGQESSWDVATRKPARERTLWPAAAIAIPLRQSDDKCAQFQGHIFATLPITEITAGLPIHINARWALSDNRMSLITNTNASSTKLLAAWNNALLADVVPSLWVESLLELQNSMLTISQYYSLWPQENQNGTNTIWNTAVDSANRRLAVEKCLLLRTSSTRSMNQTLASCKWNDTSSCFFDNLIVIPSSSSSTNERVSWYMTILRNESMRLARGENPLDKSNRFKNTVRRIINWLKENGNVSTALVDEGCPWLAATPNFVLHQLVRTTKHSVKLLKENDSFAVAAQQARSVEPRDVRDFYRDLSRTKDFTSCTLNAAPFKSLCSALPQVLGILRYCLSDLSSLNDEGRYLLGTPLLLLANRDLINFGFTHSGWRPVVATNQDFQIALRLFEGKEYFLVDQNISYILSKWAHEPNALRHLALDVFELQSIERILPVELNLNSHNVTRKIWDRSLLQETWLAAFYKWITSMNCRESPFQGTSLINFALLPGSHIERAADGKEIIVDTLTRPESATSLIRHPFSPDGIELISLNPRIAAVKRIVQQLGIPILMPGYHIPIAVGVPVMGPKSILQVLTEVENIDWSSISFEDCDMLLQYFNSSSLDEVDLRLIRDLPIFEVSTTPRETRLFVTLSELEQPPRQLPAGFAGMKLSGIFFKSKSDTASTLYELLGITLLSRAELYIHHVFPKFSDMTDSQRISHLRTIEIFWYELISIDPSFPSIAKQILCVRLSDGSLAKAEETFDPTNPVFREFFPERIPSAVMEPITSLLRLLGMRSEFSRNSYLECARAAAATQDIRRAEALVNYILDLGNRKKLAPPEDYRNSPTIKSFYDELRELEIVKCIDFGLPVNYDSTKRLWKFKDIAAPKRYVGQDRSLVLDKYLVWSQIPVMDIPSTMYLNIYLREALEVRQPTVESAVTNLQWMYNQPKHQSIAKLVFAQSRSHLWFTECCQHIYDFLTQSVHSHADFLVASLAGQPSVLCSPRPVSALQQREWIFVRPDSIFAGQSVVDLPPYCFHLSSALYSLQTVASTQFLKILGIADKPKVEQVQAWCANFKDMIGGRELTDLELDTSSRLLTMLSEITSSCDLGQDIWAPNTRRILKPIYSLVVLDAPWLKDRVNFDILDVAHKILHPIAKNLGINGVSLAISEKLVPGFDPEIMTAPFLNEWETTIQTVQFRNGLKRLLYYETQRSADSSSVVGGEHVDKEIIKQIHSLHSVSIVGVRSLRSFFFLKSTGQNITKIETGSHFLVEQEKGKSSRILVCAADGRGMCLASVSLAVNWLIDKALKNLQPIEKIVDSKPDNIPMMLSFLQVPAPPSGLSDHLGLDLEGNVVPRIVPVSDTSQLSVGANVAWQADSGGNFKYGRVNSFSQFGIDVEISGSEVASMPLARVRTIRSEQEYLADQKRKADESSKIMHAAAILDEEIFDDYGILDQESTKYVPNQPSGPGPYTCVAERGVLVRLEPNESSKLDAPNKTAQPGVVYDIAGIIPGENDFEYLALVDGSGFYPFLSSSGKPLFVSVNAGTEKSSVIERQLYKPPHENWEEDEERVLENLKLKNEEIEKSLEEEPAGIDELFVQNGFPVPAAADKNLADKVSVEVGTRVRRGYDLVRWGNFDTIAFFHERNKEFTKARQALTWECVAVLKDVARVFDYDPGYITLFYQPNALSRFIKQKLMYNIWPIEENARQNNIDDVTKDPFAYMYFYGLCIHKLGHFHDIVHGTRHDFYMNELRIEFMMEWIELLESKGFDPAELEISDLGTRMLKATVF